MNILITGGSGYVGNHLNTFYKNKANVTCLSRGVLDISDTYSVNKWFEGKYFDVVLHAAISGGNRVDADTIKEYKNNIKMIDNLYEHKNKFGKLISFGSGAERTGTWYGRSKEYIHRLILNTNNWYNLRIYGIFDKDENDYRFIKANIL
jgi:nucleoside-diphosphate-sugar epimerase